MSQTPSGLVDETSVDTLFHDAIGILEAAETAARLEGEFTEWSILIGAGGALRMVAASDWPLESLQAHHGARIAYRVRQRDGDVRVEGRAGSRTCLFEATRPDGAARLLLAQLRSRLPLCPEA